MLLFARFLDIRVELLVQYYSHFQNSLELQKNAHLAFCVQPPGKILSYSFLLKMMRCFTFGNITRQPREFKYTCPGILSLTYKKFQLPAIRDITKGYFQEHTFKKVYQATKDGLFSSLGSSLLCQSYMVMFRKISLRVKLAIGWTFNCVSMTG